MSDNFVSRCEEFEAQELSLRGTRLTGENYAELILFYLVQQRFFEAKYCFNRAAAKHSDPILKELAEINHELQQSKFGDALRRCRALNLPEELMSYVVELKKRLIAIQLELIGRCYSIIQKDNLAALLGLVDASTGNITDEAEANEIFAALLDPTKFGWTCTDGGLYIAPNSTAPNYMATLQTLVDVDNFGPMVPRRAVKATNILHPNDITELKALVSCSDFFDVKN